MYTFVEYSFVYVVPNLYFCMSGFEPQRAAVASRRATNLATHLSIRILDKKISVLRFQKILFSYQFNKFRYFTVSVVDPDPHGSAVKLS